MPLTIVDASGSAQLRQERVGTYKEVTGKATFDASYPTGGETGLSKAKLGFKQMKIVLFSGTPGGYSLDYDYTNEKVLAYVEEAVAAGGPLVEVANTTDLSAVSFYFVAKGV